MVHVDYFKTVGVALRDCKILFLRFSDFPRPPKSLGLPAAPRLIQVLGGR